MAIGRAWKHSSEALARVNEVGPAGVGQEVGVEHSPRSLRASPAVGKPVEPVVGCGAPTRVRTTEPKGSRRLSGGLVSRLGEEAEDVVLSVIVFADAERVCVTLEHNNNIGLCT